MTAVYPTPVVWDVRELVRESLPPSGDSWRETFLELRRNPTSAQRVWALAGDIAARGEVLIPVKATAPRTVNMALRIVDGIHRIAAAYSLMLPVPVLYVPPGYVNEATGCGCLVCKGEL